MSRLCCLGSRAVRRYRTTAVAQLGSAQEYAELVRARGGSAWVFAYGSLMWSTPEGVSITRRVRCRLDGFVRSFCVHSRNYRGSPAAPGLVLGRFVLLVLLHPPMKHLFYHGFNRSRTTK